MQTHTHEGARHVAGIASQSIGPCVGTGDGAGRRTGGRGGRKQSGRTCLGCSRVTVCFSAMSRYGGHGGRTAGRTRPGGAAGPSGGIADDTTYGDVRADMSLTFFTRMERNVTRHDED